MILASKKVSSNGIQASLKVNPAIKARGRGASIKDFVKIVNYIPT